MYILVKHVLRYRIKLKRTCCTVWHRPSPVLQPAANHGKKKAFKKKRIRIRLFCELAATLSIRPQVTQQQFTRYPLPLNAQVWIPHMAGSSYAIASRSMRICSIEFAGDKKIATNVDTSAKGKWPPIDLKCQEQSWYDLMISFLIWPCTAAWMCTLTLWCLREKVFPEIHYDVLMSDVC